jgi:hypothetical protein
MGIPEGAILQADEQPDITVVVAGEKKVKFRSEEISLTAATQQALGINYNVRPAPYWRFNGRLLSEIYEDKYAEGE